MTRQDYELIANSIQSVLKDCHTQEEIEVLNEMANSLAVDLKDDNSRFDRDKFLKACGL